MRINRIFTAQSLATGNEILLEQQASHHLLKVLRLQAETPLDLFNGQGGEFRGTLLATEKKLARVRIDHFNSEERESLLAIHLGIAISRGDRFDWVVQKATELGVTAITPLITERTEVKLNNQRAEKKHHHWQQIVISACEQSGRNRLPQLNTPQKLQPWLLITADKKLVAHHKSAKTLAELTSEKPASVNLLIGPEGGLADHEIDAAIAQGFQAIALGPRVLRTETAPLAAISLLQVAWGDMG